MNVASPLSQSDWLWNTHLGMGKKVIPFYFPEATEEMELYLAMPSA